MSVSLTLSADYPLRVNAGGSAEFVNRGMDGTPAAVLVGPDGSRAGVIIGIPCRLGADEASPWRLAAIGDIDRKSAREMKGCTGQDWVHLVPIGLAGTFPGEQVLRTVAPLFGKHVRIVYEPGGGR